MKKPSPEEGTFSYDQTHDNTPGYELHSVWLRSARAHGREQGEDGPYGAKPMDFRRIAQSILPLVDFRSRGRDVEWVLTYQSLAIIVDTKLQ